MRAARRPAGGRRRGGVGLALAIWIGGLACATACATGMERIGSAQGPFGDLSCARFSPTMRTAVLEASVAGGGPQKVDVAGWMCGRQRYGSVRIVMLRYTPDDKSQPSFLVPVLFEEGALVAFGWHLLETQPERYGTSPLPSRTNPWRVPSGWSGRRYR